jgi:hypothetical protein
MLAQREYVIYLLESSHSGDSRHWSELSDIPGITPLANDFPIVLWRKPCASQKEPLIRRLLSKYQ